MKLRPKKRTVVVAAAVAAAALAAAAGFQVAQADETKQAHYFLEVGGTAMARPAPDCTASYDHVNDTLPGQAVKICYPASIAPIIGVGGEQPAPPGTPGYDASVNEGVKNLIGAIHDIHGKDPGARMTIVGYSQGADVADRVLEKIATGEVQVPRELFAGKLYSDPRQPGTGIWAKIPAGTGIPVPGVEVTSPGAGPTDFAGIPVERHCVAKDGICDATSLESIPGYFQKHFGYPDNGGIIESTVGQPAKNEVIWH